MAINDDNLEAADQAKPKYTLAQLLAQTKPGDFRLTPEDREWLNDPPVGIEEI